MNLNECLKTIDEKYITPIVKAITPVINKLQYLQQYMEDNNIKDVSELLEKYYRENYVTLIEKTGWLFGDGWSWDMVEDLSTKDAEDRNKMLEAFYTEEQINKLFHKIECVLNKNNICYDILINECISSFKNNLYLVTIPSLMSIVDGLINSPNAGKASIIKTCQNNFSTQKNKDNFFFALNWMFLEKYVEGVYKTHKFTEPRLPFFNRNWILHGRDNPHDWKRLDAINLFNTIRILLSLQYETEDNF